MVKDKKMKQQIIFISDGSSKVVGGFATILAGWLMHENTLDNEIILLTPNSSESKYHKLLIEAFPEFSITLIRLNYELSKDTYYIKLILLDYISKNNFDLDTQLIYIDYDHIVLSRTNFPQTNNFNIIVSSEIKNDTLKNKQVESLHYNTSLIISNIETLSKISKLWQESYKKLKFIVSTRFLEEISFSKACTLNNVLVSPSSIELQSGWCNKNQNSSLFHYGGLTEEATLMKKYLVDNFNLVLSGIELRERSFKMAKKYLKILNKV